MSNKPRKPRTWVFPKQIIDLYAMRMRAQLRKIQRYHRRRVFTNSQAKTLGVLTITESYKELVTAIEDYAGKHGLNPQGLYEKLDSDREEVLKAWRKIADDM